MKPAGGRVPEARRLRKEFDRGFAEPQPDLEPGGAALLALRAGGLDWALPLDGLGFLTRAVEVAPYAGCHPAFRGLATLRGEAVPVWDLAALLGLPARESAAPWLARGAGADPWALAFEAHAGLVRPRAGEVADVPDAGGAGGFARGVLRLGGARRAILDWGRLRAAVLKAKGET